MEEKQQVAEFEDDTDNEGYVVACRNRRNA